MKHWQPLDWQRYRPRYNKVGTLVLSVVIWLLPATVYAQSEVSKSGVSPQVISLPSGPGSLEGLGESFQPDLSTGTANYAVPLLIPPARGGFQPEIALVYNGGNPNSTLGLGWKLESPFIQRQTNRGLPSYSVADTYIYSTAEELTAVGDNVYRLKNEGRFMRFRWLPATESWEATAPDGTRYLFGESLSSRIQIPYAGLTHIFRWCLERQIDPNGNEIHFLYKSFDQDRYAYIHEIRYNFASHDLYNSISFHYEARPDIFIDRTSRAPITLSHRLTKIDVWGPLGALVRRYQLSYLDQDTNANSFLTSSLLASIRVIGNDEQSRLPATKFAYSHYDSTNYAVATIAGPQHNFRSINEDTALVDMTYDALPDLVYTPGGSTQRLAINRGNGRWESTVQEAPLLQQRRLSSPNLRLADMDGDGMVDLLLQINDADIAYYAAPPGRLWNAGDLVPYQRWHARYFDLGDGGLQLLDMNNDKRIDVFQVADRAYKIWLAPANGIWSSRPDITIDVADARLIRDITKLRLADFTGDRLQDLVELENEHIAYFPHNGAGQFDTKVEMRNAPYLSDKERTSLLLGDINNDGLTDLILPLSRRVHYWLNRGDNSFTPVIEIPAKQDDQFLFPELVSLGSHRTSVSLADLDGDGAVELLYSQYNGILEYVDFYTGTHANLLTGIDNGLGRSYEIRYKSSTEDYIADQGTVNAWRTTIPFPVQVVSQVIVHDANSGAVYITDYHYRNGYYDGKQKEFRGFAEVIETQYGDESAPTTVTHYFYDVGEQIESRKGLLQAQQITDENGDCTQPESGCYQQITNTLATYEVASGIHFSTITRTHTLLYEATSQPVQLLQSFSYDSFGNQTASFNFGQVCPQPNGGLDTACGNDELLTYTSYAMNPDRWIVNAPAVITQTDVAGNVVSLAHLYYDGNPYVGLRLHSVERGNLTRQEESLGPLGNNRFIPTKRQAFDQYGNVIGIKDANDHVTTISYDDLTHTFPVTERIHLDAGRALTYTAAYDIGFGKIISATEFNGNTIRFTYDTFGRITSIVEPGDTVELPTQQFSYTLGSPRSSITTHLREQSGTAHVRTSVVYFDGLGRKLQSRSKAENGQVIVADALTFNARQSERDRFLPYFASDFAYQAPDPTLPHSSKEYDSVVREVRTINPDGSFTAVKFLPLAQIEADEEDNHPDSHYGNTPKILRYDGLDRLVAVTETNQVSGTIESYHTTYQYDVLGNLTTITDTQGNTKTMRYDSLSRKIFMDDPDRGEMYYVYDDAGNLRQTMDAKGQVITYTYDAANRPLTESWQTNTIMATNVFTYHYDNDLSPLHPDARNTLGQLTYVEDPSGAVYLSYDARGNVLGRIRYFKEEDITFVTRVAYDAMDRLVELTYPDGFTVTYTYNDQGLLDTIPNFVDNIDYTTSDQRATITYTNNTATTYAYDTRLRMEHLRTVNDQTALQDLTYVFDRVSNIQRISDHRPDRTPVNDQTQTFLYDSLYRLTQASGTYGQISYAYDSIGNLVHQTSTTDDTRLNLGEMRYGEDGAGPHALTFAGGEAYRYDANGNRLGKGESTYVWNMRDWLLATANEESSSIYAYDSDGQRLRQTVTKGGVITTTLYPGQYAEVRGDQFIRYVFDDEQRIAQIKSAFDPTRLLQGFSDVITIDVTTTQTIISNTLWYIADHLGGASLLLDREGQVVSEVAYYPYGLTRYEMNGGEAHYRFTGKELDASGLYYYGARYYDALTGRFISVDPLYVDQPERGLENPQLLHLYAYAANNPIRYIDPNGLGIWDSTKGFVARNIDKIQTGLDVVGMVPVVGEAADLVNAGIYAARGDYTSAALSAAAMVPFAGAAATGAKLVNKAVGAIRKTEKLAEAGASVMKAVGKVCSFSSDTEITTLEGLQPINQLQVGDLVLAYDESSGKTGFYTVTATFAHVDPLIILLSVNGEQIETTPEHPFYTAAGEWIPAGQLQIGDSLRRADGSSGLVTAIALRSQTQQMYNITVAEAHTYFIGDGKWLVHNACPIKQAGGSLPARKSEYGSYTNTHASGKKYAGMGGRERAQRSGKRIAEEHNDPLMATDWTPAESKTHQRFDEALRIQELGGASGSNYNKIHTGKSVDRELFDDFATYILK
jgi:RHS repeat-associated protein